MKRFTNMLIILWCVLAILCFMSAFALPMFWKICSIVFGVLNCTVIVSWTLMKIEEMKYKNEIKEEILNNKLDNFLKEK